MAVVNAAPYASGILAKGPDAAQNYAYRAAPPDVIQAARKIADVCAEYRVPLAAVALQFSLRDPRITSTIVGVTRPERIAETLDLASLSIVQFYPDGNAFYLKQKLAAKLGVTATNLIFGNGSNEIIEFIGHMRRLDEFREVALDVDRRAIAAADTAVVEPQCDPAAGRQPSDSTN